MHRQPLFLQQSPQEVARQRAAWAQKPAPDAPSHLIIRGQRVAVPFPAVSFTDQRRIAIDAPLPTRTWARNLLGTAGSAVRTLLSPSALRAAPWGRLLDPARYWALWTQGDMQVCAVPRKDRTGAGVDAVVLHWDSCNSSAQTFEVLRQRGLSAHLLIDSDATVYQLMDLAEMKAYHAGGINERSIGIEINNPVDPFSLAAGEPPRALVRERVPHEDGLCSAHLDFTPLQKLRTQQVLDVLQAHFAVPRQLPPSIDAHGEEHVPTLVASDFAGVCGHYHLGLHKTDPGLSLWPMLRQHWADAPSATKNDIDPSAASAQAR
jgi:N-acetyl-anhydromuramyl-L-alanine amidase AmpD